MFNILPQKFLKSEKERVTQIVRLDQLHANYCEDGNQIIKIDC